MIKLGILTWENYPEFSQWVLNAFTSVLIRESRERFATHRRGGNVTTQAEIGVMHPQARNASTHQSWRKEEWLLP